MLGLWGGEVGEVVHETGLRYVIAASFAWRIRFCERTGSPLPEARLGGNGGGNLEPWAADSGGECGMDELWNYLCLPIGQGVNLESSVQQLNTFFTGTGSRG